jgi:hypothetical protein
MTTDADVLSRLRRFLLATSAALFVGTAIELWLVGHDETAVQLIPFALCGLGLAASLLALARARRAVLVGLRACALLVAAGGLYGVYEHVSNNFAFLKEVSPNASAGEALKGALGGANPLLAPGIMILAAALALAATYRHVALEKAGAGAGPAKP